MNQPALRTYTGSATEGMKWHDAILVTLQMKVPLMLEMVKTKISDKGRLVIPAQVREALGMRVGETVFLEVVDDELRVSTFESRLRRTQENLRQYATPGKLMSDELIEERRREFRKEEEEARQWGVIDDATVQSK